MQTLAHESFESRAWEAYASDSSNTFRADTFADFQFPSGTDWRPYCIPRCGPIGWICTWAPEVNEMIAHFARAGVYYTHDNLDRIPFVSMVGKPEGWQIAIFGKEAAAYISEDDYRVLHAPVVTGPHELDRAQYLQVLVAVDQVPIQYDTAWNPVAQSGVRIVPYLGYLPMGSPGMFHLSNAQWAALAPVRDEVLGGASELPLVGSDSYTIGLGLHVLTFRLPDQLWEQRLARWFPRGETTHRGWIQLQVVPELGFTPGMLELYPECRDEAPYLTPHPNYAHQWTSLTYVGAWTAPPERGISLLGGSKKRRYFSTLTDTAL